jgi:hypothetical protein
MKRGLKMHDANLEREGEIKDFSSFHGLVVSRK